MKKGSYLYEVNYINVDNERSYTRTRAENEEDAKERIEKLVYVKRVTSVSRIGN